MITENIVLRSELKKGLKHLAIDKDTHVSTMLINGAKFVLDTNSNISETPSNHSYDPFTMKIDEDLKLDIKTFCSKKDVKIKDFWNEVAYIIVEGEGVDVKENI